ncbi:transcriptional regulator, TetR family [Carnobacterium iners]|uniref:Transcriptional regulator, TetR family n=1 Tax=Carnobacterium iners TaxID=1073423 RepID=A0A1X7N7V3_9LACT|nr:TetR/AcrR family transcriptional regulator [Carnobacterium iners]SEK44250.1 transcriptional regulator, TetR family [Carnobacterium iners]SMH32644.1 transcriptional regulator, TetR family [Carnobacterium iners]
MPTKTFFNLSKEKQGRLITAASKEFSRVSLNEASINNIIKTAEISRGSFYQYFEDKEDLYYYYLGLLKRDTHAMLIESFKKADGDLFEGFKLFFPQVLTLIMHKERIAFFKHLFLHMDYRTGTEVAPDTVRQCESNKKSKDTLKKYVNVENLDLVDIADFPILIKFMMSTLFGTIGEGFNKKSSEEEIISRFNKKMKWIEYGVRKDPSNQEEMKL